MQRSRKPKQYIWLMLTLGALLAAARVSAGNGGPGIVAKSVLDGSQHQIKADSTVTVEDSAFFNPSYTGSIDTPYTVQNQVTLMLNEASNVYLRDSFSVSVRLRIYYQVPSGATDSIDQAFAIHYDSAHAYAGRNNFVFAGSHKVTIRILSVTSTVSSWDPTTALLIENQLTAKPTFVFSCTKTVTNIQLNPSDSANADELPVTWTSVLGADQYDLEWTYVDSSALAAGRYNNPATHLLSPALIFQNNATRITTTGTAYNIPLIYDNTGTLFIRVRPVQLLPRNGVLAAEWSSDPATPVIGQYTFRGHERPLNWQSNTSFAEEGKRKVVVQYYDGSLRSRQTVTKDNTTNTTIVGGTYYDYQGRPTIQVMPAPTLSHIIAYTAGFNVTVNAPHNPYSQSDFDTLANPSLYCSIHASPMDTLSGASRYYSPANPRKTSELNQFIPDAQQYPFSETEYTADNTGRINRQGGVGPAYQLGMGHETKYYYGTPSQYELDALFGTEVGVYSHYFKNMVQDANGQYSISYVDMHGRTIATALAGSNPSALSALPSNTGGGNIIENLSDSSSVFYQDLSVTSQKTLLVSTPGEYHFNYSMNPGVENSTNCSAQNICYTCVYDLEVTITDNCNNQLLPNAQKYDTVIHNVRFDIAAPSHTPSPLTLDFTLFLQDGSYVINKKLTVDQNTYVYYRDSVYLPNNTCQSLSQFIDTQRSIAVAANQQCVPTCTACMASVGTWSDFWAKFITQTGLTPADTAAYRQEAMTAYQNAIVACSALCSDSASEDVDIENAMLQDVTPPYGQYANTTLTGLMDGFNIFYIPKNTPDSIPVFQLPRITYLNAGGNPDSVYLETSNLSVVPNLLSMDQFVQNFQPSWAYQLLPYHPEYCKLVAYKAQHLSNLYDRQMESINDFQDAYSGGYLNPTSNSSFTFANHTIQSGPSPDPFSAESSTFKSLLETKLKTYVLANADNPAFSMWALACIMTKCPNNDKPCINQYAQAVNQFDATTWCKGDLDAAWQNFKELYQTAKKEIMDVQVLAPLTHKPGSTCSGYSNKGWPNGGIVPTQITLFEDGHQTEFNDASLTTANGMTSQNSLLQTLAQAGNGNSSAAVNKAKNTVQDSAAAFYTNNVNALVQQWTAQLSPCNYPAADLKTIILPELTALCQMATDDLHPLGASTLPPGKTYGAFTSFQDILNAYNKAHGITNSLACNAELITSPQPYGSQPIYSYEAVTSRPTDCECAQITKLYNIYQVSRQGDASFSAYLQRTQQINMSDADLNQLMAMCNYSTNSTCINLSTPILLPPAFQCNSGQTCVPCQVVDSMYKTVFLAQYPGDSVSSTDTTFGDTIQYAKNLLFRNFMNNRLGFNLQASDYLTFMATCQANSSSLTDSLKCSLEPIGNIFNTGGASTLSDIRSTTDNGYVMAGSTTQTGGTRDAYIVKTDHSGNVQWARAYGGTGLDYLSRIKSTSDKGSIAVGTTTSDTLSRNKVLIVKMDFYGNLQWKRVIGFNTASGEYGRDIIQTSDGGYAVLGSFNYGSTPDCFLSKLDAGGNIQWSHKFGTSDGDEANSLAEVQGNLLVSSASHATSSILIGDIYTVQEATGEVTNLKSYTDVTNGVNVKSTWFGDIYNTATGYQVFMNNTTGSIDSSRNAFVNIAFDGSVQAFIRSELPSGSTTSPAGTMVPTSDGGVLLGETINNSTHIYWQRLNSSNAQVWASVTNLPDTQTIAHILQNTDNSFTSVGTDSSRAMFLNLDTAGQTGCYDNLTSLGVSSREMTVASPSVVDDDPLTTTTDTTFHPFMLTTLSTIGTGITCPGNNSCYTIYSGPTLCGKAAPIFPPATLDSVTTCTDSSFFGASKGTVLYNNYNDSLLGNFEQTYNNNCLQAAKSETFTVSHNENEYHYTLYYYDQAGNLVKTVPPAGVHPNFDATWLANVSAARVAGTVLVPNDSLTTNYRYNTLNQVVSQLSPDGGRSNFWYDRLGRLAVSQNAVQSANSAYSYTQYDSIGRITEVGQLTSSTPVTASKSRHADSLASWINNVVGTKEQITQTIYDLPFTPVYPEMVAQNLRNRVSYSGFYEKYADINSPTPTNPVALSYFSYDILGNVDTLVHEYRTGVMKAANNSFKKVVYDYDLQSGKVDKVAYQHGYADAFYHSYIYDAENRLTNVLTSSDSINWDNDAYYSYYLHGPLARSVIGDQQVQGINYAYTLQGWMKSVNPSILTGSGSGNTLQADGTTGSQVASNVYNLQLNYFNGDFQPINGVTPSLPFTGTDTNYRPLYNGNISSMGTSVSALKHPLLYNYQYDQLNRLVKMDAWKSTDSLWSSLSLLQDFQERVAYDPNGNILQYKRNGDTTFTGQHLAMDSLSYHYTYGTNKLDYIRDPVSSSYYGNDIDNQSSGNYGYDAIGELTKDNASGITGINWTVYGKIAQITKSDGSTIGFTYDAAGNRISKTVASGGNTITTWYVRDAQGNVLSVYTAGDPAVNGGDLTQTETDLYGSSRLGMIRDSADVAKIPKYIRVALPLLDSGNVLTFMRGYKLFELSNHLGNVLATVSDKKFGVSLDGSTVDHFNPQVINASDYYPFGSQMPGRDTTFFAGGNYRYGFNGKENDNEVKGVGDQQDYGMRIYDPRVGRFLSVDPLEKKYPELTPYQYASNRPIDGIDQDGLEYFSIANVHSSAVQKAQMMQLRSDQTALRIKQSQPTFTEYHTPSNTIEQQKHDDLQTEVMDNAGLNSDGSQKLLTRLSANKGFQNLANRMVLPAVKAYSYVAGIGEEEAAIETFYRAMSEADFAIFQKTGAIPATGETFISPTAAYSSKYTGVLVEINTKQGTYDELMKMGVRNVAEKHPYPELPLVENTKGWTQDNAFFKYETPKGGTGQVNIGLGKGKALETFNKNIVSYKVLGQK